MNPRGFGFVKHADDKEDLYIHKSHIRNALDGDEVVVEVLPETERGPEGRIVKVVRRANETLVGTLEKFRKLFFIKPDNPRIALEVVIPKDKLKGAKPQEKVLVLITDWHDDLKSLKGEVIEILGRSDDRKLDSLFIAKSHQLPLTFPEQVEKACGLISDEIAEGDWHEREDLTLLQTLTIDPVDARDFDDAISIEKIPQGWHLGIHIADVSAFVRSGSVVDLEALKRGCTVYFSDRTIRMIPDRLSKDVCSLDEGRNRLAKSVMVVCSPFGEILDWRVVRSVIRSKKRFHYDEVSEYLAHPKKMPALGLELQEGLKDLDQLTQMFSQKRLERGALELDVPEIVIHEDNEGRITKFTKKYKQPSHRLVEECMLLANELVSRLMDSQKIPALYRIHEKPSDKDLKRFTDLILDVGIHEKVGHSPLSLQKFLRENEGSPLDYFLHYSLLRSLKMAKYSSKNMGHYALALDSYLHFTSPIRRYPDLMVHQALDEYYFKVSKPQERDLDYMAQASSEKERIADQSEMELTDLKRFRYFEETLMKEPTKIYNSIIVDVKESGIAIQEIDTLQSSFIHVSSMGDDYYVLDPSGTRLVGRRRHRKFALGQSIRVRLGAVDGTSRKLDFKIA